MRPVFFWVEVIEGSATRRACQHPKASGNNCTHGSNGAGEFNHPRAGTADRVLGEVSPHRATALHLLFNAEGIDPNGTAFRCFAPSTGCCS